MFMRFRAVLLRKSDDDEESYVEGVMRKDGQGSELC